MTTFSFTTIVKIDSVIPQEEFVCSFLFVNIQIALTSAFHFVYHQFEYQIYIFSTFGRCFDQFDLLSLCKADDFFSISTMI